MTRTHDNGFPAFFRQAPRIRVLYPDALPHRGEVRVELRDDADDPAVIRLEQEAAHA